MEIIAVAAIAENGIIGDGPTLPWNRPEEVRRYRERVAEDTVVIGRRTFEMFENPPGARQLVLSRSGRIHDDPSVTFVESVEAAIDLARDEGASVLYVLGGAAIYEAFLPHYDRMLLSRIDGTYDGDAKFPEFDRNEWTLVEEQRFDAYTLETWERHEQ